MTAMEQTWRDRRTHYREVLAELERKKTGFIFLNGIDITADAAADYRLWIEELNVRLGD